MNRGLSPLARALLSLMAVGEGDEASEQENNSAEAEACAVRGISAFSFRLAQSLRKGREAENFACSPFSCWLPLAALSAAASGDALDSLLRALGVEGMERGALAEAAKALIEELEAPETVRSARAAGLEASSPAAIANAVVVSEGAQLAEQFAADFFRCYKGAALKVDFADPQAAEAVNRWASEQTRGLIPSIVDTLDEGTVASLANAVYFSDRFGREFDPARTRTEAFRALKGASEAQFMHKSGRLPYYEDAEMQAVRLDFSKGSSLSLLLPKKEGEARLASLTAQQAFETAWDGFEPREGALALPKFKIEGSLDLSEALKELGIPLFHASGRPLQGLLQGRDDAFLSSAVQKAVVEVEEKGTTAAASTVFGVSATSVPLPARPFDMRCDRPFAFVLSCPQRGGGALPLFVGCVMNPGAPILES